MNNKLFALAMAGSLALASCGSDNRTSDNDEVMQARIDSAVNARMEEMQAQLAAQNDSLINALAMQRADSMMASARAAGNNNTGVSRTVRTTRPTTSTNAPATTTQPTRSEQDSKFDTRENGVNGSRTITPAQQKEQDDKFNRRGG